MSGWALYGCLGLGFASALVAGVFQSFSDFVMAGLARARPAGGIESMQQLNQTVLRSVFLTTFLFLVPLTTAFAVYSFVALTGPARLLIIAAAALYVTSVFLVTMFGNVPMNNRLAALAHDSDAAREYWQRYTTNWTRWNHIRTLGAAATAALYLLAITQ
ncbi:MAG: anthrone oxygenase family protein [Pseudomonadota bacterium]